MAAACGGHLAVVEHLVQAGANIDTVALVSPASARIRRPIAFD